MQQHFQPQVCLHVWAWISGNSTAHTVYPVDYYEHTHFRWIWFIATESTGATSNGKRDTKGKGRGKRTTGHPENWSCYCTRHVSITVTENLHTHTSLFQHSQHFTEWTLDTICVDRHIHTQIQIAGISSWECRHTFVIQNSPVFISLGFLCLSALISRNEAERCHNGTIISWTSPCQVHLTAGIWTSTYFIFKNEK